MSNLFTHVFIFKFIIFFIYFQFVSTWRIILEALLQFRFTYSMQVKVVGHLKFDSCQSASCSTRISVGVLDLPVKSLSFAFESAWEFVVRWWRGKPWNYSNLLFRFSSLTMNEERDPMPVTSSEANFGRIENSEEFEGKWTKIIILGIVLFIQGGILKQLIQSNLDKWEFFT